jgi:archaellum biogenesis protein FlaJ (TadC family)
VWWAASVSSSSITQDTASKDAHIDLFFARSISSTPAVAGISHQVFTILASIDLWRTQTEIKKIAKEINIMNVDSITALKNAIDISPSRKFQEVLQGIIGTIQSGSELHLYLQNSVTKLMEDDFVERKKDLDLLGVIAEIFVTCAIAFPIFLVIILTVFGFFGALGQLHRHPQHLLPSDDAADLRWLLFPHQVHQS